MCYCRAYKRYPWVAVIYPFLLYQKTHLTNWNDWLWTGNHNTIQFYWANFQNKTQNEKKESISDAIAWGQSNLDHPVCNGKMYCHDNMQYKEAKKKLLLYAHTYTYTHPGTEYIAIIFGRTLYLVPSQLFGCTSLCFLPLQQRLTHSSHTIWLCLDVTAVAYAPLCLGISINSLLADWLACCLPVCLYYSHHASTRIRYYHPESVQQPWWVSAIHHVLRETKIVLLFFITLSSNIALRKYTNIFSIFFFFFELKNWYTNEKKRKKKRICSRLNSFQIIIRLPKGAFSSFVLVRASFIFFITSSICRNNFSNQLLKRKHRRLSLSTLCRWWHTKYGSHAQMVSFRAVCAFPFHSFRFVLF